MLFYYVRLCIMLSHHSLNSGVPPPPPPPGHGGKKKELDTKVLSQKYFGQNYSCRKISDNEKFRTRKISDGKNFGQKCCPNILPSEIFRF